MTENGTSVLRRYYVGIASVLFAALFSAGSAQAGGWEEFIKRCLVPMEVGQEPSVIGLDLKDGDPVGQAFDLPGETHIAIRPPYQDFGTQCLIVTKPVEVARDAFDEWVASVVEVGRYTPDPEIQSRWLTSEDNLEALALDVWEESGSMVFQLSVLESGS